jgi:hypothetical protein
MNKFKTILARNRRKTANILAVLNLISFLVLAFCIINPENVVVLYAAAAAFAVITPLTSFLPVAAGHWEKGLPEYQERMEEERRERLIQRGETLIKTDSRVPQKRLRNIINEAKENKDSAKLENWLEKYDDLRRLEEKLSKMPRWRMQMARLRQELEV